MTLPDQPQQPYQHQQPPLAPPVPQRKASHASTCLIFGILAVAAGLIGPQLPGYLTSVSGVRYSVAGYHAVCTSGLGELAQAGHRGIAADCSQAALLMTAGWVAVGAGALLLLAAVLLWTRRVGSAS